MFDSDTVAESTATAKADAVVRAVQAMAERDADMVCGLIQPFGATGEPLRLATLLRQVARLRNAQFRDSGLYRYAAPESSRVKQVAKLAREAPESVSDGDWAMAESGDLLRFRLRHFTPFGTMTADECVVMAEVLRENGAENRVLDASPFEVTPHSPEARAWWSSLSRGHGIPFPVFPVAKTAKADAPDLDDEATCPLEVLRQKAWVTEVGAARLLSLSKKGLGNRRRAGRLPRDLYDQNGDGGHVRYRTQRVLAFADQSPATASKRGKGKTMGP